jgi:plasmid stabilization system protein ParE
MVVKRHSIVWSEPAERDLDDLLGYIALANLDAAKELFGRVLAAVEHLAVYPELGRSIPDLGRPYRELVAVRPFRIIYRIEKRELRIIGVMRAEQLFDPGRFLDT